MNKKLLLILSLILIKSVSFSQYANLGSGKLKNEIWWIDWSGFTVQNGATKTITTHTGLTLNIRFSKVVGVTPQPNVMNTWLGSTLYFLYDFSNPLIKPALLTPMTTSKSEFTLTITASRNGIQIPFSMIVADAEATAAGEQTYLTTSGGNWQTIEFFRNSSQTDNPVIGCGTKSVTLTKTFDESALPLYKGQSPLLLTESSSTPLVLDVVFDKQPPHGGSALAFGVLEPIDRGDLPASYGFAQHQINYKAVNSCNFNPPYPSAAQDESLYLGNVPPDADPEESLDDNATGVDEEAISNFPQYNGTGSYSLTLPVHNSTGKVAYLSGWFDYNQNGSFENIERVGVTVNPGTTNVPLTWNDLPSNLRENLAKDVAFRFRLSSDANEANSPTGWARDGEVEDYLIKLPFANDSLVINDYAAVNKIDDCQNSLDLDDAASFNPGDTVMLIQMKGAIIDSSNTASFGTLTSYNSAGNYEMNLIQSKAGNVVILKNLITRSFDFVTGKVQLVRVPYYGDFTVSKTITALPWNGSKGGVVALNVAGTLTLNEDIDVTGKGFRTGKGLNNSLVTSNATGFFYNASSNNGGEKGEGIYSISNDKKYGRGAPANGGGGGNAHNAGGGGGGNGGQGGKGGDQYEVLKSVSEKIGGRGGYNLSNSAALNRVFQGGAGGMGQANDLAEFPAGNGGGIIIITANSVANPYSFRIKANGENAHEPPSPDASKDGTAGGGAGGTVLMNVLNVSGNLYLEARGGKGADQPASGYNGRTGPGGGGGGGMVGFNQISAPAVFHINVAGGMNGTNTGYANDPWDAQPGQQGLTIPGMNLAVATVPFKPNIDSVRINETIVNCLSVEFNGISTTQNFPILKWEWEFGDNTASSTQNTDHEYSTAGNYSIKLRVEDSRGCADSIIKPIQVHALTISKTPDTAICEKASIRLKASGASDYEWFPSAGLDDTNTDSPLASPTSTTKYFVKASSGSSCTVMDSITVTVNPLPMIVKSADTSVCPGSTVQLSAAGGDRFTWSPSASLNDPGISTPVATPAKTTTYLVKTENSFGCTADDSIRIHVFSAEQIQVSPDASICKNSTAALSISGGQGYTWYPANLVETPSSAFTATKPLQSDTIFYVDVVDKNTCRYTDSVRVTIKPEAVFSISKDTGICANQPLQLSAQGGDEYNWISPGGIPDSRSGTINISPQSTTTYSVTIFEKACGKSETLSTTVRVLPSPVVQLSKSNDISCKVPFAQLTASPGGMIFDWLPTSFLDDANKPNPHVNPPQTTTYHVTARDQNGCMVTDSITVFVSMTDKAFMALPNAFTPNGDGLNDCFGIPPTWGEVTNLNLRVYNRFGQMVFQTNDPAVCWDGTFKGEPQNSGVFAYTISATTTCEVINFKGSVVLIR